MRQESALPTDSVTQLCALLPFSPHPGLTASFFFVFLLFLNLYMISQDGLEVGWLPRQSAGWFGLDPRLQIQAGGSGLEF